MTFLNLEKYTDILQKKNKQTQIPNANNDILESRNIFQRNSSLFTLLIFDYSPLSLKVFQ